MKVVYFAATLFVFLIVCDASDEPKCKQGETYEKDCNTCHCTDAGVEVCTEKACYTGPQFPDTATEAVEDHTEIPEANGQVCTPNETKMQDCNRCKCSANGIVWICTRRLCLPTPAPKISVNEPGFTCVPKQVFKDDCNTCSCDDSGTLARCTAMACDPNERQKRSHSADLITTTELPVQKGNDCVPGTRWKNDCNWCWCSDNGFAACTLKGCLGHGSKLHRLHPAPASSITTTELPAAAQEKKVLGPNRVRRETETTNHGTKSGKNRQNNGNNPEIVLSPATDPANSDLPPQNVDESKLSPDAARKPKKGRKSNSSRSSSSPKPTVSAHPTGTTPKPHDYVSTSGKEYKESDLLNPNFTCTPSESFKVECNTCWCAANGKSVRYCTRQACHPKVYPTLAPAQ